jgi:uncharacterized membrane protein
MTDLIQRPPSTPDRPRDATERAERNTALTIYGLYLGAPFTAGVTGLVGAIMASGRGKRSGPLSASHFRYQVWTFGASAGAALTGGFWASVGGIASMSNPDGAALALAGGALAATSGIAFVGATLFGLTRAAGGEPIGHSE